MRFAFHTDDNKNGDTGAGGIATRFLDILIAFARGDENVDNNIANLDDRVWLVRRRPFPVG